VVSNCHPVVPEVRGVPAAQAVPASPVVAGHQAVADHQGVGDKSEKNAAGIFVMACCILVVIFSVLPD